jgi:protein-S-isoprenylcysteine O-methyltransferase Ste14
MMYGVRITMENLPKIGTFTFDILFPIAIILLVVYITFDYREASKRYKKWFSKKTKSGIPINLISTTFVVILVFVGIFLIQYGLFGRLYFPMASVFDISTPLVDVKVETDTPFSEALIALGVFVILIAIAVRILKPDLFSSEKRKK